MLAFIPHHFHIKPHSNYYSFSLISRKNHAVARASKSASTQAHVYPRSSSKANPRRRRACKPTRDSTSSQPQLLDAARATHTVSETGQKLRRQTGTKSHTNHTTIAVPPMETTAVPKIPDQQPVFEARNQITVKWLWLVSAIAHKLYHTYTQSFPEMRAALSPADLIQEGVCGLMNAVEKWDPSRGYPFDAFAFYTVKHAVIRAVQNQSRPIRLPVHVLDKLARMRKVRQCLEMYNRPVSVDAIARGAGVSRKAAELYLARSNSTVSIDAPLSKPSASSQRESSENSLSDFLVDHSVDVAREVERSCTREAVAQLVNTTDLLELERSVLFLKFGLGDGVERVRTEVSRILDVRVHNVRRAEISALKKLRHTIGSDVSAWTELIS